jgi:hypothetical protein
MNSPDVEYETTLASPSERSNNIEMQIAVQLSLLRSQINSVNDKLCANLKILNEKQSENKHLKELLAKLETSVSNIGATQTTEATVTSEAICISCKVCVLF